jgi:16S rRNA (cytosine967-C5)-methyltransferase
MTSERVHCCAIVQAILQQKGSLASAFGAGLKAQPGLNVPLVQELAYGVCRWYHRLDFIAGALLEKPLRSKDRDIHCLILVGLYQLFFSRVPPHAVLHETVEEAAHLGKPWAKNLINAVLREAQRREVDLLAKAQQDYALWYSHPEWLLNRLKQDWPQDYRAILDANNTRAPLTLRVNLRLVSREAYRARLQERGKQASEGTLSAAALVLDAPCDVHDLPGFAEGLVSVQDEASQLVARFLPLAPGLRVLDACAAPGGKTCALLEAEPGLRMIAADREARRLPRIAENLARLHLQAEVVCADITEGQPFPAASFERIVLDVPCSATGVIRRHPDIKLLRSAAEVQTLTERQAALLNAAWDLLLPGGYLLYSTCSTLRAENSAQVARFVADHPDAVHHPLDCSAGIGSQYGLQLLPTAGQYDGFYYALLQK